MVLPGLLVDALGHLQEDGEILRAQPELSLRPAEDESLVVQVAGGVLALVPPVLCLAWNQAERLDLVI